MSGDRIIFGLIAALLMVFAMYHAAQKELDRVLGELYEEQKRAMRFSEHIKCLEKIVENDEKILKNDEKIIGIQKGIIEKLINEYQPAGAPTDRIMERGME